MASCFLLTNDHFLFHVSCLFTQHKSHWLSLYVQCLFSKSNTLNAFHIQCQYSLPALGNAPVDRFQYKSYLPNYQFQLDDVSIGQYKNAFQMISEKRGYMLMFMNVCIYIYIYYIYKHTPDNRLTTEILISVCLLTIHCYLALLLLQENIPCA